MGILGLSDSGTITITIDSCKLFMIYVTGPMKINHVSANYTELYFC